MSVFTTQSLKASKGHLKNPGGSKMGSAIPVLSDAKISSKNGNRNLFLKLCIARTLCALLFEKLLDESNLKNSIS
jgi:hypothetical protein